MEWRKVLDSPERDLFRREIPPATLQLLAGINFIEGIDRVLVTHAGANSLLILGGTFNVSQLREMAVADGGVVKMYRDAQILSPADPEESQQQIALVGEHIVLLGSRDTLLAAVDRAQTAKILPRGGGLDLWVFTNAPSPDVVASEFGMALMKDGSVQLDSTLHMKTPELAAAAANNARSLQLAATPTSKDVRVVGRFVPTDFQRRTGLWRTTLEQSAKVQEEHRTEPQQPAGPQKIRIFGLEGGTKEIPLPPPPKF